jgi:hypothetical protein
MKKDDGFISWLILLIIALALLKYFFNWSIFDAANSEQGRGTILYIREVINLIWSYLAVPFTFLWREVVWPILHLAWQAFQAFLEWGRANARQS